MGAGARYRGIGAKAHASPRESRLPRHDINSWFQLFKLSAIANELRGGTANARRGYLVGSGSDFCRLTTGSQSRCRISYRIYRITASDSWLPFQSSNRLLAPWRPRSVLAWIRSRRPRRRFR